MTGDFFSAVDMAELKAVGESAMGGMLVIYRFTEASNGMGSGIEQHVPVGTVPCHIWRNRYAEEKITGAQVKSIAAWYVAVPVGTDIRETTDWGVCNDVTYQITHVPVGVTWNAHIRCEAETYNRELKLTG